MGFLGAGLFGMLAGGGFFSGLGSLAGFFGFLLQAALVFFIARFALNWWRRRNAPAFAGGIPSGADAYNANHREQANAPSQGSGLGGGLSGRSAACSVAVVPRPQRRCRSARTITTPSNGCSVRSSTLGRRKTYATLRRIATPEMADYFAEDLAANQSRGVVNKVGDVKLLQGDLAEAWSEGGADYATVAMRFALTDKTVDRTSGRVVDGSDEPQEAVELWTFRRDRGASWTLSAIQQTS